MDRGLALLMVLGLVSAAGAAWILVDLWRRDRCP